MKQQTSQQFTQISVFKLWKEAEIQLGLDISARKIIRETGVHYVDIQKMLAGELVAGDKVAKVVEALYEISSMLKPNKLEVQTVKTVTWLEADDEL